MFKKLKDKKGFTLVELIVVLVILAILAALLIPALTGYIDKANAEKVVSQTRMITMAVQTEASSCYGKGPLSNNTQGNTDGNLPTVANVNKLAEVKGLTSTSHFKAEVNSAGVVLDVEYDDGTFICLYKDGQYTVAKTADNTKVDSDSITVAESASFTALSKPIA